MYVYIYICIYIYIYIDTHHFEYFDSDHLECVVPNSAERGNPLCRGEIRRLETLPPDTHEPVHKRLQPSKQNKQTNDNNDNADTTTTTTNNNDNTTIKPSTFT